MANDHNKDKTFPPEPLTRDEVRLLIRQCSTRGPTGLRGRAMIVAMYRGGLRCFEMLALKPSDVDLRVGTIRVLDGKGGVARTVGICPHSCEVIARYLTTRVETLRRLGGPSAARKAPLFCTLSAGNFGTPLLSQYVRLWLPRIATKAGVDKRCHAHGLRHTMAVELVDESVSIVHIQTQLGHSNVATTDTYLRGIAPGDTIKAMRSREGMWK